MEFPVPQFIEMETKIVGPFTWRQFLFVGGAGTIIFFLYFVLKNLQVSFLVFVIIAIILGVLAFALAFVKVGGRPIPTVLISFITYSVSSKIYLWRKKPIESVLVYKKEKVVLKKEKPEERSTLMVTGKSRLRELSSQVELKTK